MTSARWCFTLNNPTEDEEHHISHWLDENARYGIFGREVGNSGTPHLQGFVILHNAQRRSFLRNNLNARGHYERAGGTSVQARDYCRKDGDFSEFGQFPERQGRRTDLDELLEWSDKFTEEHGRPPSSPDIAKHQPKAYIKYPRFKTVAAYRAPPTRLEFSEPREGWQRELVASLEQEADDRTITFVVDQEGGKGKTWLCRYLLGTRSDVQVLGTGGYRDLAHMIDEQKKVYLFNIARGQMEHLNYSILESLKDKIVVSGKYAGTTKTDPTNKHVVVFANEYPDATKLTADRYNYVEL